METSLQTDGPECSLFQLLVEAMVGNLSSQPPPPPPPLPEFTNEPTAVEFRKKSLSGISQMGSM